MSWLTTHLLLSSNETACPFAKECLMDATRGSCMKSLCCVKAVRLVLSTL